MAKYSIITTCKGRLGDLMESLPQLIKQPESEVIVVDYDCPQGTKDVLSEGYPSVATEKVFDRPRFNLSEARNIGTRNASGDIFIFIDADVVVGDNFVSHLGFPNLDKVYGVFRRGRSRSLNGSCIIRKSDFFDVGGYDELLSGYSGEDLDIYMRLRNIGVRQIVIDTNEIKKVIEQSVEEKTRYRQTDLKKDFLRGQLYQLMKEAVLKNGSTANLSMQIKKRLMNIVDKQLEYVFRGESDFKAEIEFEDKYKRGLLSEWEFSTTVSVNAKKRLSS